jgi:hypothetical protein
MGTFKWRPFLFSGRISIIEAHINGGYFHSAGQLLRWGANK